MLATTRPDPSTAIAPARPPTPARPAHRGAGLWFLPVFGALTLWATFEHQPDPSTQFADWSRFVTTDRFLAQHLVGSILGQAAGILGAAALVAVVVRAGGRSRAANAGFVLTVFGAVGLVSGFGVAAFAQPAIGRLELAGDPGAHALYDAVYGVPTFVVLIGGTLLFSAASVLLARGAASLGGVPRWAVVAFAASGPLIGILGVVVGPFQTVGSLAALAGGIGIARAVTR